MALGAGGAGYADRSALNRSHADVGRDMFSTCQRSRSPSTDHREPQRDGTAAALRAGRGLARGLQDARRDVAGVVELMPARGERGSPARRCASRFRNHRIAAVVSRLPLVVPGLGGRGDRPSQRGHRSGAGARRPEPSRGGLCTLGRVRAPPPPDGRLGRLWTRLHSRGIRSENGGAKIDHRSAVRVA